MSNDLKALFRKAYNRARDDSLVYGRVGRHNPDTTIDYEVTGRKDYLYVTLADRTVVVARNEAGVPQTADLQVKLRVERGTHVIVGRSTRGELTYPDQTPPSGVWPHILEGHSNVTTAFAPGDGVTFIYNETAGKWEYGSFPTDEYTEDLIAATISATAPIGSSYDDGTGELELYLAASAANKMLYSTGVDTWAEAALTSFARTLLDDADQATARGTLGVTDENIQDLVGLMLSGNTETGITVTYQDSDGTIDFVLDDEYVQDLIGLMVSSNTETGIAVTYDDSTGKLNFDAQTAGDLRYGRLASGNTWTGLNDFENNVGIESVAITGNSFAVLRNLAAASTNAPMVAFVQDNAGDDQAALIVQQDGSGDILSLFDGATAVLKVTDGGRLEVAQIIRALTSSGLQLQDDGGTAGLIVVDGGDASAPEGLTVGNGTPSHLHRRLRIAPTDSGGTAGYAVLEFNNGTDGMFWFLESNAAGGKGYIRTDSARAILLQDNASGSGNVGIGPTAPLGKLHINDGIGTGLFVSKTGVAGTSVPIITGIVSSITVMYSLQNSDGTNTGGIFTLNKPASVTVTFAATIGGTTWTFSLTSAGAFAVIRSAGSDTANITMWIVGR